MRYLDPVALAKLRNFSLELRRISAEGHVTGRHRSAAKGLSHDFAQHRAYVPGDEVKSLDWKVFARQERFYVREYQSENIFTSTLILDASGSMAFSAGGRPSKWDNACRLAMALSYLVLAGGDSVGLVCFDTEPRDFVPSRTSFGQLEVLDSVMDRRRPGAETRLAHALEMAVGRVKRRSLIILVSDLLGEPEAVLKVASALQARRHELMVLQVLDPAERDFPFDGPTVFESLEDSSRLYCDASALRAGYRGAFARQQRLYEAGFNSAAVSFITSYTDRPWDEDLVRLLGVRGSAR